jgi:hypothetical protein
LAVVITATVGSASANSFVTSAECDTYHEGRLNATAWSDAVSDDKNRALVEAQRELNTLSYEGNRVDSAQALQWPRWNACNPDGTGSSFYYLSTEIPQRMKDAQCELALEFLKSGTTDLAALPSTDGVIQKTVDVLTTIWDPRQKRQGLQRFPRVWRLIAPLLDGVGNQTRIVRG